MSKHSIVVGGIVAGYGEKLQSMKVSGIIYALGR